jgi:hypothetical protein
VKLLEAVFDALSVALRVTVNDPLFVAVPVISPPEDRENPVGSEPDDMLQV